MRSPRPLIPLLTPLVASAVAGCSLVGWGRPHAAPTLTLTASSVTRIDDRELAATVVVTVSNPNADPVRIGRVRYRLTFPGGVESGGTVRVNDSVPAGGQLDVDLPVQVAIRRLLPAAAPLLLLGELPYDLEAGASVGAPFFGSTIDLQTSSALRLDLPLELVRPGTRAPRPSAPFAIAAP